MKIIAIALKDLTHSFRSAFLLVFMFAIPLLVTAMFTLMFGSPAAKDQNSAPNLAVKIVLANLDQGSEALSQQLASIQPATGARTLGELIVQALREGAGPGLIEMHLAASAEEARWAVDRGEAAAALIIPADCSAQFAAPQGKAALELYRDPASSVGVQVLQAVIDPMLETMAGAKIAAEGASLRLQATDPGQYASIIAQYQAFAARGLDPAVLIDVRDQSHPVQDSSPMARVIGPIMGGMLILFAFFTGGATSQTILTEEEEGTLPRLFTTPTRLEAILGGKILAVGLTVLVQVTILLAVSHLIFSIPWGAIPAVALAALGIIACSSAFGVFLTSLLKSSKQGGAVFGGLMTGTGMLGMMPIFNGGMPGSGGALGIISLLTPQGWAVRGLLLAMRGASLGEAGLNLLVLAAASLAFFAIGVWRFQRRYA